MGECGLQSSGKASQHVRLPYLCSARWETEYEIEDRLRAESLCCTVVSLLHLDEDRKRKNSLRGGILHLKQKLNREIPYFLSLWCYRKFPQELRIIFEIE